MGNPLRKQSQDPEVVTFAGTFKVLAPPMRDVPEMELPAAFTLATLIRSKENASLGTPLW